MKLKPLFDRIIFKEEEVNEITDSGIVLARSVGDDLMRGKVIAVGPGRIEDGETVPVGVKEGDIIVYLPDRAADITLNGEQYMIIEEFNVLALLE